MENRFLLKSTHLCTSNQLNAFHPLHATAPMEAHQANDALSPEERLFSALFIGSPLSQWEGVLEQVEDVDARGLWGRTALHLAVRAGKDEWVVRLLGMGADPGLRDAEGDDVVKVAEVMSTRSTDDANLRARMEVLKLVGMVHQRDGVQNRNQSVSTAPIHYSILNELTSLKSEMLRHLNALKDEVMLGMSREIGCLRESIVDLKRELESRDALLFALETGVTSLVEKSASLEEMVRGWGAREGVTGEAGTITEWERVNVGERDCVEAMMGITKILGADAEKESSVRRIYRRLQSESPLTAAVLGFIAKQSGVSVYIDCSSNTIGMMKGRVKDHDGEEKDGDLIYSFADYSELRVYVGAAMFEGSEMVEKVGASDLVTALCQLAVYIAFKNGGRPYSGRDTLNRRLFKEVLTQAEEEIGKGVINVFVSDALENKTRKAKEISLISVIPRMFAYYGSNSEEASRLCRTFPLLFGYYESHVMSALGSTVSNHRVCP